VICRPTSAIAQAHRLSEKPDMHQGRDTATGSGRRQQPQAALDALAPHRIEPLPAADEAARALIDDQCRCNRLSQQTLLE